MVSQLVIIEANVWKKKAAGSDGRKIVGFRKVDSVFRDYKEIRGYKASIKDAAI